MSIKGWIQRQVGEKEGKGRAADSFPDTIVSPDNPMSRGDRAVGSGERRSQQPQMGDDKRQKQRGRIGDYR